MKKIYALFGTAAMAAPLMNAHTLPHRVQTVAPKKQARVDLVGLRNPAQARAIRDRFGVRALWMYSPERRSYVTLGHLRTERHEVTLYASAAHARAALGNVARSLPHVRRHHSTGRHLTTAVSHPVAPAAVATAAAPAPAPATPPPAATVSAPAATSASTALGAPANYSASQLVLNDSFSGNSLSSSTWNSFITSKAANGSPWNNNGAGGSSPANPGNDLNAEYDLPGQVIVNNGLDLRAHEQATPGMLGSSGSTYSWASGAVSSYGKFQFTGGYLQVRAKMPAGNGMWPSLWMLPGPGGTGGDNFEVDLFEGGYPGNGVSPNDNFAWHLHGPSGTVGGTANAGVDLTAGYHVYGLEWIPGQKITWFLDGRQIAQVTSAQATIPTEPMELIVNLQVANSATSGWHTVPDSTTPTTADMLISNVQVYN